jgi:hypothetical protein
MNDREIRVGTDRDRALAWRQSHDPGRVRAQLHRHLLDRDATA